MKANSVRWYLENRYSKSVKIDGVFLEELNRKLSESEYAEMLERVVVYYSVCGGNAEMHTCDPSEIEPDFDGNY